MTKRILLVMLAALMTVSLWGCGSNRSSSTTSTTEDNTLATAPRVGINNCLSCHNPASELVLDWGASRHGNRLISGAKTKQDTAEAHTSDDPRPSGCGYCHPTIDDADADYAFLDTFDDPAVTDWSQSGSMIACEDCHGGGQYHNGIRSGIPFATPGPEQCGQCHYLNSDIDNDEWAADGEYPHHTTSGSGNNVRRNVTDSHVDDPATSYESEAAGGNLNYVEGYAIRYNQQNGCVDCHFQGHAMDLQVNYQWATSGHAGNIKTLKDTALLAGAADAATLLANVTAAGPDEASPWVHYDWDAANRQSCQMCHTSTGAANFMIASENGTTYDPADNDFSHLQGWSNDGGTITSSGQNELLYCWGCHSDSDGTLRAPGQITLAYENNAGVNPTLPDMGNSNVCLNCHSGRGGMPNFLGSATANPAGAAINGGTRTHYFASGATIFHSLTNVGYEFPTEDYTDSATYTGHGHYTLGCAECHMTGEPQDVDGNPLPAGANPSHTFQVVTKTGGLITDVVSEKCVECHTGQYGAALVGDSLIGSTQTLWDGAALADTVVVAGDTTTAAAFLEAEAAGYHEALTALGDVLTTAGTTPKSSYPYFTGDATDQGHGGGMHNWSYLHHEPGGFAHNRVYVKRLIFDSIDWLTDPATGAVQTVASGTRALDGQITLPTTGAFDEAIDWLGGDHTVSGVIATRP